MEALYDIKVIDTDAPSQLNCLPESVLESGAKEKKLAVVEQKEDFTPIVDG